jgi:uncharacterized protein YydD (DUF2326 family)
MILRVLANKPTFKTVEFSDGFNVVWADRTKESTKKDSRNGLGKTTLIEIIHFCLGATAYKEKGLTIGPLLGWEFSLELRINEQVVRVSRSTDNPGVVHIEGNTTGWPISPKADRRTGRPGYNIKEWISVLGALYFGLPTNEENKYQPTFRSLISFFIRRQKEAFITPFEHHRRQMEWDKQANNAFLLGLGWEQASELQELKDRKKGMQDFLKAARAGVVKDFVGSLGELEAKRVRLSAQANRDEESLQSFKVHPQYERIRADANRMTREIHEMTNSNVMDQYLLELYEKSLVEEEPPASSVVEQVYNKAGVALSGITLRRLEEVREFHRQVIENRRRFLAAEIDRLKRVIAQRDNDAKAKTEERSALMNILKTHGALEEYTLLQKQHMDTVNELNSVTASIETIRSVNASKSELNITREVLQQKARLDYDERRLIREQAISLFNSYSEFLYSAPGRLVLDIGPTGFRFDVEIERSGSSGISNMKIFCYDLMLAKLWAERKPSPRLLIHDSTIFDGVDERQRALALELAARESKTAGFQYICTLNSDYVPWNEFPPQFDLLKYIKLRLTDESADGCLLGIRY